MGLLAFYCPGTLWMGNPLNGRIESKTPQLPVVASPLFPSPSFLFQ